MHTDPQVQMCRRPATRTGMRPLANVARPGAFGGAHDDLIAPGCGGADCKDAGQATSRARDTTGYRLPVVGFAE